MSTLLERANDLLIDGECEKALSLYDKAVEIDGKNATVFARRAACHSKLGNKKQEAADWDAACALQSGNARWQLKRGQAHFHLGQYREALAAFELCETEEAEAKTWARKCRAELADDGVAWSGSNGATGELNGSQHGASGNGAMETDGPTVMNPGPLAAPKIRHAWYQNVGSVVIDIFAKNVKEAECKFRVEARSLFFEIPGVFTLEIPKLFGTVSPDSCSIRYAQPKVEITLKKADNLTWSKLEFPSTVVVEENDNTVPVAVLVEPKKPEYPSSSKNKKNWDAIDKDVAKELEAEKPQGEEALTALLKQIYGNASEETRRAMNKSYQESGGTVLSTNWEEVGSKKVIGSAPKGMERREWGTDRVIPDEEDPLGKRSGR